MKRILIGVLWFFLIWVGPLLAIGLIMDASPGQSTDVERFAAGAALGNKLGPVLLIVALVIAIRGTQKGWLPGTRKIDSSPIMLTSEPLGGWWRLWIAVSIIWGVVAAGLLASNDSSTSPVLAWIVI